MISSKSRHSLSFSGYSSHSSMTSREYFLYSVAKESPAIIAKRRKELDGVEHPIVDIKAFQDEELKYAQEVL